MQKKIVIGLLVIAALVIGGYKFHKPKTMDNGTGPIKIGLAAGMTGAAAEWGEDELRAAQLVIDRVNADNGIAGHRIELIVEDTKSDNVGTVNAVTKLIDIDHVPVIIGPTWADSFGGGQPIAERAKVALVSPSTAIEAAEDGQDFPFLFSTFWPLESEVGAMADYLDRKGLRNVLIINDQDTFDTKFTSLFIGAAKAHHLQILDHYQLPIGESDFRTTLLKARDKKPQALVVLVQDQGLIGPMMKQAKELGLDSVVITGSASQNQDLLAKFGPAIQGLVFTYPKVFSGGTYDSVINAYQEQYGRLPGSPSFVNGYNAALMVMDALRSGARSGEDIRQELHRVKTPGIGGQILSFRDNGQLTSFDFDIKMVRDGGFVVLP